ncbi:MAG: ASKHA domain-containing protein [Anaerolineales bacterium]|jgi:uncharacterized 2Fe-2S/4Fe-4S cluster protein (DUF4445 family)
MKKHTVSFDIAKKTVEVPTNTTLIDAAKLAGIEIQQPCGGQGRCGRCVVKIEKGRVRRRSDLRLSAEDVEQGYTLACQSVVEGDITVSIPPQEKIQRRLVTDLTAKTVDVPEGYNSKLHQPIQRVKVTIPPPSMNDQTDDWSRLQRELRNSANIESPQISLSLLKEMGSILREGDWQVTVVLNTPPADSEECSRVIALYPIHVQDDAPLWGCAIDIGTTTVSLWLVDLITGKVHAQAAEYNQQINHGEDVISRIIFNSKEGNEGVMKELVLETINMLLEQACKKAKARCEEIVKATITGNSTMIHLLLDIPASSIRLSPFITAINHIPELAAREVGVNIYPDGVIDILPSVASYVGADITAGAYSSGIATTDVNTLFMDVGTNGEIVLGTKDWLVTCACSAGPAFEGAGVVHGMRATKGAIEEVWIDSKTYEPNIRVIGGGLPLGLCGSGLLSLLAELFITGVVDKSGNINTTLDTPRVRTGEHDAEYVIAWAKETGNQEDIVITHVDIDNLLRAKAAIFAGYSVLANSVGIPLETVEQVLIGGAFGQYINVEKAIEIGLLPDIEWSRFHFLGNTSVLGAYYALLSRDSRNNIEEIANRMTYIELSADNTFYDAFTSALFLPHTDLTLFPNVAKMMTA